MGTFLLAWRLPLGLALLCLILAGLVWRGATRPLQPPPAPAGSATGAEDAASDGPAFAPDPVSAFSAVVDRPLFSRSRRPAPPERAVATEAKPGDNASPFVLSGVLIAGTSRVAFLRPVAEPKTLRVLEGETVDGWKIEKILPQRVVIGNGAVSTELTLKDRIAPATAAARPPDKGAAPPPHGVPAPGMPEIPGMQRPDDIPPETYDDAVDESQ
jgi:hypothetical protein